ncbi:MAG: hypothetical protein SP4CHLAM5_12240 [Chlamydiia bacterium]|nr:hypothetical protein [Chlamydiia bacterium]
MERELVYKNLAVIEDAVKNHQEILVDSNNQDMLTKVSPQVWEQLNDRRQKDRTKFVISKTIAYCPSVFEEDMEMRDEMFALSQKMIIYFNERQMGPLAELMNDLVMNEKKKDASYHDYPQHGQGS